MVFRTIKDKKSYLKGSVLRIVPIKFSLAKIIYGLYHRTNRPPHGHKKSYVALEGEDWNYLCYEDFIEDQIPDEWREDKNDDIRIRYDDGGDLVVYTRGQIIGILTIGRPVARFKDKLTHEITRICFSPYFEPKSNAERKLPSKFVRECVKDFVSEFAVSDIVTYIHDNQSGRYLEYAGFQKDKHIVYSKNNKGWSTRPNRSASNLTPKFRFVKKAA